MSASEAEHSASFKLAGGGGYTHGESMGKYKTSLISAIEGDELELSVAWW
jgi:hypothetical protein